MVVLRADLAQPAYYAPSRAWFREGQAEGAHAGFWSKDRSEPVEPPRPVQSCNGRHRTCESA